MEEQTIKIERVEVFNQDELLARIRQVTMLKDPDTRPYENAYISLEKISIQDLVPPQRYVLRENILRIRKLKWELEKHGIDIFQLNGFVRIHLEGVEEPVDLMPPVIEESIEKNGRLVPIVCDGMHRVYVAYLEWVIPQVIYVRGIPKQLPYYAYPVPDENWENIELRDDIPGTFIKKWHRIEDNKQLYRNFNSTFVNVGGPRGNTSK